MTSSNFLIHHCLRNVRRKIKRTTHQIRISTGIVVDSGKKCVKGILLIKALASRGRLLLGQWLLLSRLWIGIKSVVDSQSSYLYRNLDLHMDTSIGRHECLVVVLEDLREYGLALTCKIQTRLYFFVCIFGYFRLRYGNTQTLFFSHTLLPVDDPSSISNATNGISTRKPWPEPARKFAEIESVRAF